MNKIIFYIKNNKWILLIVLIVVVKIISIFFNQYNKIDINNHIKTQESISKKSIENIDNVNEIKILDKNKKMFVDIKGAVKNPGVYLIDDNTRINDILKKAGGADNANLECINLAQKVKDGDVINIPDKTHKCDENTFENSQLNEKKLNSSNKSHNLININTASKDELMTLPRVGEKKAEDIITYRTSNSFKNIEEIKNIKGVGEKTYEKLKTLIEV